MTRLVLACLLLSLPVTVCHAASPVVLDEGGEPEPGGGGDPEPGGGGDPDPGGGDPGTGGDGCDLACVCDGITALLALYTGEGGMLEVFETIATSHTDTYTLLDGMRLNLTEIMERTQAIDDDLDDIIDLLTDVLAQLTQFRTTNYAQLATIISNLNGFRTTLSAISSDTYSIRGYASHLDDIAIDADITAFRAGQMVEDLDDIIALLTTIASGDDSNLLPVLEQVRDRLIEIDARLDADLPPIREDVASILEVLDSMTEPATLDAFESGHSVGSLASPDIESALDGAATDFGDAIIFTKPDLSNEVAPSVSFTVPAFFGVSQPIDVDADLSVLQSWGVRPIVHAFCIFSCVLWSAGMLWEELRRYG